MLKRPTVWILAWGVYVMIAFGVIGYQQGQSALADIICGGSW